MGWPLDHEDWSPSPVGRQPAVAHCRPTHASANRQAQLPFLSRLLVSTETDPTRLSTKSEGRKSRMYASRYATTALTTILLSDAAGKGIVPLERSRSLAVQTSVVYQEGSR